jgi:hypothetical protein
VVRFAEVMDRVGGGVQNDSLHMDSVWIQPGCQPICRLTPTIQVGNSTNSMSPSTLWTSGSFAGCGLWS